jgi:putative oxidoreductase
MMKGTEQYANMLDSYKNFGIIGGLLLLAAAGPGKFSLYKK